MKAAGGNPATFLKAQRTQRPHRKNSVNLCVLCAFVVHINVWALFLKEIEVPVVGFRDSQRAVKADGITYDPHQCACFHY